MNANLRPLCCVLLALAGPATAGLTITGNTAPGNRLIDVEIDGRVVASQLGYLVFRQLALDTGTRQFRFLDSVSGAVLSSGSYRAEANDAGWLTLAGDGAGTPYAPVRGFLIGALDPSGGNLGVVNAAGESLRYTQRCESADGLNGGLGAGTVPFGSAFHSLSGQLDCRLDLYGTLSGTNTPLPALDLDHQPGQLRFVAWVGNGTASHPRQLIEVEGSTVRPVVPAAEQDLLRIVKSVNYWHDTGRFSQGVSLYAVSRTEAVHGFWNTFTADGLPQWLYLDASVVDPSGRREVVVSDFRLDPDSGRRIGQTVGRGTLTYLDCNNAEFQVRFADSSERAALFRRSIPVSTCDAVP